MFISIFASRRAKGERRGQDTSQGKVGEVTVTAAQDRDCLRHLPPRPGLGSRPKGRSSVVKRGLVEETSWQNCK